MASITANEDQSGKWNLAEEIKKSGTSADEDAEDAVEYVTGEDTKNTEEDDKDAE